MKIRALFESKIEGYMEIYKSKKSKLSPHEAWIWDAWEKRWPIRAMAEGLLKERDVKVAISTLHNFIKVRLKKKKTRQRPIQIGTPQGVSPRQVNNQATQSDILKSLSQDRGSEKTSEKKFNYNTPENPI